MKISIDMEILDEAHEVVMKDSFAQYLLAHTTNFETCLFIIETVRTAVEKAKEKLNEKI